MITIPTKIISEPYIELDSSDGTYNIILPTDAGVFQLREICEITGKSKRTLSNQIVGDGWRNDSVLNPLCLGKKYSHAKKNNITGEYRPKRRVKRDPETIVVGTWERSVKRPDLTEKQIKEKRREQKRRDEEYKAYLRHHRSVCR